MTTYMDDEQPQPKEWVKVRRFTLRGFLSLTYPTSIAIIVEPTDKP